MKKSRKWATLVPWLMVMGGGFIICSAILNIIGIQKFGALTPQLILGAFGLGGVYLLGRGLAMLASRAWLGRPSITLPTIPLKVGDTVPVHITHTFPHTITTTGMAIQLIVREIATYQQGEYARTVTHDELIDSYQAPGQIYQKGQTLDVRHGLKIPRHAMHSFKVHRNEVRWVCRVVIALPALVDFKEELTLAVQPALGEQ